MLNATETHSSFSAPVQEKAHSARIDDAKEELQNITEIFQLIAYDGETPLQGAIKWLIPKIDNISEEMDKISSALLKNEERLSKGDAQ